MRAPVVIAPLVDDAPAPLQRDLNAAGVSVTLAPASPPAVSVDRVRLQQVLMNLILNARQALGEGAGKAREIRILGRHDGAFVEAGVGDAGGVGQCARRRDHAVPAARMRRP